MMIYQSFSMLITMMMTLNILLVDGNTYLIIHGNNQTDWSRIRFPYKSVYDLPNTLHCQQSVINNFHQCEIEHHEKWEVSIDSYVSNESKKNPSFFVCLNNLFLRFLIVL